MSKPPNNFTLRKLSDRIRGSIPRDPSVDHILNEVVGKLEQLDRITQHEAIIALIQLSLGLDYGSPRGNPRLNHAAYLARLKIYLTQFDTRFAGPELPSSGPIVVID